MEFKMAVIVILLFVGFPILAKIVGRSKKHPDRPSWKYFMGWSDE
jgi:hypothetical protein